MSRNLCIVSIVALSLAGVGACNSQPVAPSDADATPAATATALAAKGGRAATTGVVYVTSQGLYYDTFAARDPLPMEGKFQLLVSGTTEFGPGDPEYLGGRWWEDLNGNGVQDQGDHFFLCPLLPPGRHMP
jgi:hypothetical protein